MIEVKQLRESISKALKEFYEVPLDESINMELVYFGKQDGLDRYELDGIEFFVAEDEDLKYAIETCIDEEFMPEWEENSDAVGFSIDAVDFIEGKDEKGSVEITVFGEELDESLNEGIQIKTKGTTGFEARILIDKEQDDKGTWKTYRFTAKDAFMAFIELIQKFDTAISADLEEWVNKENSIEAFDEVFKLYYDGYMEEAIHKLSILYKHSMDPSDYDDDIYELKYSNGRVVFENEEGMDESLNEIHQSSPQLEIAHELRAGITQGDLSDGRSWSCAIDVVGQEGEDGSLGILTKPLRDEALRNIADVVEEGNLKDILELELDKANLDISDKLSVKDSANKYPQLIKTEGDNYYFTIRFDIEMDEEDLDEFLNEEMHTFGLEQIGKDIEELDIKAKFKFWPGSKDLQINTNLGTFYVKEFEQGENEYVVTVWQDDEHFKEAAVQMTDDSKQDAAQILKIGKRLIELFGCEDLQESLNESVSTESIKEAVLNAIKEHHHEDPDLMEYVVVECTEKEDGQIVVEVRDELSYDGMVRLAERLDRVVTQFDPEAYFDQECPGIMTAYINLNK